MSHLVRNIFADFCDLGFEIHAQISVNQLKDISNTSECFSKNKKQLSFMVFDIESFYPIISKNVFMKAIQFNKQATEISDEFNPNKAGLFEGSFFFFSWRKGVEFDSPPLLPLTSFIFQEELI